MPFDPTMKKKKKKKKTGFDLDAAMGEDSGAADGQPSAPAPVEEEEVDKPDQEVEASQEKVSGGKGTLRIIYVFVLKVGLI